MCKSRTCMFLIAVVIVAVIGFAVGYCSVEPGDGNVIESCRETCEAAGYMGYTYYPTTGECRCEHAKA